MGVRGTASQFGVLGGPCLFSRIVHHPITSQDVSDINDRFRSCLYSISKFTCSLTTTEKRKNSTLLAFAPFFCSCIVTIDREISQETSNNTQQSCYCARICEDYDSRSKECLDFSSKGEKMWTRTIGKNG